jgi:hypothetical protein
VINRNISAVRGIALRGYQLYVLLVLRIYFGVRSAVYLHFNHSSDLCGSSAGDAIALANLAERIIKEANSYHSAPQHVQGLSIVNFILSTGMVPIKAYYQNMFYTLSITGL